MNSYLIKYVHKGGVYARDLEAFLAAIFWIFNVECWFFYIVGEMGASLICLNYRSQNPKQLPSSKWPKMVFFGLKMAIFDVFAIFS